MTRLHIACERRSFAGLFRILALMVVLVTTTGAALAPADVKVAVVIGNSAYAGNPLANPGNDAKAMSRTLRRLGFLVFELTDADKLQMMGAIRQMGDALSGKGGVGMLYFAGHGLQRDWHNYMVPVNANLANATDIFEQTVDLDAVISVMKNAGTRMNIIVLDACRDNPFSGTGSAKGLAPMDAPSGTILAYATAPGNVALDGELNGNGLYTHFLLQELDKPTVRIEDVFKRVRLNVRKQSEGRQVPWESTSLEEDFYFREGAIEGRTHLGDINQLEANFLNEKAAWDAIKNTKSAADLYAHLSRYPSGFLSEHVQFRLDQLQAQQVSTSRDKNGIRVLPSGHRRFSVGDETVWQTTDLLTKNVRTHRVRVTYADDETVELNRGAGILNQMGGVIKNQWGTKDPAMLMVPADIRIGKSWRSAFSNTRPDGVKEDSYWDNKVVGVEEVAALGGKTMAFKIERRGLAQVPASGERTSLEGAAWVDPETMQLIRIDSMFRTREGKIAEYSSAVAVSRRSAPSSEMKVSASPK